MIKTTFEIGFFSQATSYFITVNL